jgi:tetratricopeptide (TPR) repeat protein
MMTTALQKQDPAMAAKARQYLLPQDQDPEDSPAIIAALANDPDSLSAIASSYWLEGLHANARPFWDKTLQSQPFHETALSGLIQLDLDSNDLTSAERNARKLTEFAPAEATHWAQLSNIQWKLKRYADAIASAEKALQLDPDLDETRRLLIEAEKEVPK